jgi:hypothetical protein
MIGCDPFRCIAMLNHSARQRDFDELRHRIQSARSFTTELVHDLVVETQTEATQLADAGHVFMLQRWVHDGAWTDAMLLLAEMKLPQWKLRQIVFDEGQWHCTLSRQPNLPLELDEVAECSHEVLPLAILGALVEALSSMRSRNRLRLVDARPVPFAGRAAANLDAQGISAVSCDDFR